MNLKQIVLDKIAAIGPKEAATYFGRTPNTINLWKAQPDKIPAYAAEQVMNDAGPQPPDKDTEVAKTNFEAQAGELTKVLDSLYQNQTVLDARLSQIENMIRAGQGLPPKAIENVGMSVVPNNPPVTSGQTVPPPSTPVATPAPTPQTPQNPIFPGLHNPGSWTLSHTDVKRINNR